MNTNWWKKRLAAMRKRSPPNGGPPAQPLLEHLILEGSPMQLGEYAELVRELLPPTDGQKTSFARFVSTSHSWYKHLPLGLPGAPFQFFIDPHAGMDRILHEDGRVETAVRAERGFHYSWIPTAQYRERFGYLAFSCGSRSSVRLIQGNAARIPADDVAAVFDREGRLRALPPEVIEAGRVGLTRVIHPAFAANAHWIADMSPDAQRKIIWPEASGGQTQLARIIACAKAVEDTPIDQRAYIRIDGQWLLSPELYEEIRPERARQLREMEAAMHRMYDVIHAQVGRCSH